MTMQSEFVAPDPIVPPTETGETTPDGNAVEEPSTFTAEYVKELRDEAASHRVKAKKVDDANARLTASYATSSGRLVDPSALEFTDALLGDDGLVDPAKVTAAIDALVTSKPYLARRTPTVPITQGVQADAINEPGLFALVRERA